MISKKMASAGAMGLLLLAMSFAADAQMRSGPTATGFEGFLPVRPHRELYVDYVRAQAGRPTVVLLNGLTYSTRQYDAFVRPLLQKGIGVVRFDFDGMGKSLLRYAPSVAPYPWEQQARDTQTILRQLGLRPPYHLVGLSYGGGIQAAYALLFPREVKTLIMIAPYTQPLESQDNWIKSQIWATRQMFPTNPASDDELYEYFLRQIIYATYPQAEPIVLENPFKLEATYNLVRGIRQFRPVDVADRLPAGTVHLMVAALDQYIPSPVLETYWQKIAPAAKMSRLKVYQSEHKIPEAVPEFAAAWVMEILKGNPLLRGGRDFEGWPYTMRVRSGNIEFRLQN